MHPGGQVAQTGILDLPRTRQLARRQLAIEPKLDGTGSKLLDQPHAGQHRLVFRLVIGQHAQAQRDSSGDGAVGVIDDYACRGFARVAATGAVTVDPIAHSCVEACRWVGAQCMVRMHTRTRIIRLTDRPLEAIVAAPGDLPEPPPDPLRRFDAELDAGVHWYPAALRACGEWRLASETHQGRRLTYLVAGEALDLVLLIDRIASTRRDAVPRVERDELRFHGRPPIYVSGDAFASALGEARYKTYLNHFYGIDVEEAVVHAVELEASKAHRLDRASADVYPLVYGQTLQELLAAYRVARGGKEDDRVRWADWNEFTYWRFRLRLRTQVPARMASDTRKGIALLQRLRGVGPDESPDPLRPGAAPEETPVTSTGAPVVDLRRLG